MENSSSGFSESISGNQDVRIVDLIKVINELKASVQFLSDKFDQLAGDNTSMLKKVKNLREENSALKRQDVKLEDRITSLQARETSGGVEVSGFSNLHLDNVNDFRPVIMEIANDLLQCGVEDSDLLSCHRVDNKKGSVLVARSS
ncbi:hypothetical protein HHI36_007562 [Cryptolaemus montrouzieri]|uniref:Uncharacterized protein n=1 Tax=Cryptolaemus montrouzieri TaxID=559131 RepID=A0ABD2MQR3_9CUCU